MAFAYRTSFGRMGAFMQLNAVRGEDSEEEHINAKKCDEDNSNANEYELGSRSALIEDE